MSTIKDDISAIIEGDIDDSAETKEKFRHDASMFEMIPELVIAPKHSGDVQKLVGYVAKNKKDQPNLSLTVRSGGTCMSGGAVNDSLVLDFAKYFNAIGNVTTETGNTQPGVFYRDFEKATLEHGVLMPSYPASRDLCTVGGMVANNAGGERSLQLGKTEEYIESLKVVFADGNEYVVRALSKSELDKKMAQGDFEGNLYKKVFDLVEQNYDKIKAAKPNVSKDSTGYHIWNVWDRETGVFDLTRLIVGSQGTLGIVTDITFKLSPAPKNSGTLVVFLRSIDDLGNIINDVLKHKPATFEGFDNYTLMLSFKLFFFFYKRIGWFGMIKLGLQLFPELFKLARGIPKYILLVEFQADSAEEVANKVHQMRLHLAAYKHEAVFEEDETEAKARKFWIMRRESFNLLRQKVRDKHTAPFMDDLVVPPSVLPQFLPEVRAVINKYNMLATIAGHMGDGNFHIIPLMNIEKPEEKAKLEPAMREINDIVLKYKGSLSGEHNDGMIRGPWLKDMYGEEVFGYFKLVKDIFDPQNIFNPHKKTDAEWSYSMAHLREKF
ncbi:FAD-binding oxidoreductase [Candidatus Saccharibacteria bacterium]|nr:FAD-binding oxidoreductase [Candidatus Saccharibacteria bacterium]